MKLQLKLFLFIFFNIHILYGQPTEANIYRTRSNCDNYNTFLTNEYNLEGLRYYALEIDDTGVIELDLSKSFEYEGVEALHPLLGVDEGSTFDLVNTTPSRYDEQTHYHKYQQYHYGIKVEGGGYTVGAISPDDPGNPCFQEFLIIPFINSNFDVNMTPGISEEDLATIISAGQISKSELVITQNLNNECSYNLAWKVELFDEQNKTLWVDAHEGNILKEIKSNRDLMAPTLTYDDQLLDDVVLGGQTTLISVNTGVRTFDYSNFCPFVPEYLVDDIPVTNASEWTTEAAPEVYQAHFAATEVVPVFNSIGIDFGQVNVASVECVGAFALGTSTVEQAFIGIGFIDGATMAIYDVVGHELGHSFLNSHLDYTNAGNASLQEGIADMLGTYVESVIQDNSTDWIMGDDEPNVATVTGRDLENPAFTCFDDVEDFDFDDRHIRSTPLSHWFYLISAGDPSQEIPALGIGSAINIVLESLNFVGRDADYDDFARATLKVAYDQFDPCSPEGTAVRKAWRAICIHVSDFDCEEVIVVNGPAWVCEETEENVLFCVDSPIPDAVYRWTFPIGWTVPGANGNIFEGTCLNVTDFPKYDWYPRVFNLKVYAPSLGSSKRVIKRFKLVDCNGDDPTCEEFFELGFRAESEETENQIIQGQEAPTIHPNPSTGRTTITMHLAKATKVAITIFDINGKIIDQLPVMHAANGLFQQTWNNHEVGSGIYFVQIKTDQSTFQKKLIITN